MSRQQVGQMICDQHLAGSNMKHRSQQLVADRHQRDTQTRRAPKPTDTSIPPGAEAWALGDTAQRYRELQSLERRIDATLMRKTTEHNDSTWQDTQSYGVMRIWISNTIHEPNPASPSAEPDADIGVTQKRFDFSLRIEGRLLPDSMSCIDVGDHSSAGLDKSYVGGNQRVGRSDPLADDKRLKLTEAFDSIQVIREFPKKDRGSDLTLGKWNRSPVPHDDGHEWLTFQGSAARRTNVLVELVPRHNAARFKLHPLLANILGMEEGTQQDVMSALWHYTENLRPEHDLDRRSVIFDDRLRKLFGADELSTASIPARLEEMLEPVPAIILPYTIHTAFGTSSPQTTKSVTIFDIRVPLPCPAETAAQEAIAAGLKAATLKQISVLAAQQELLIQALLQANTKQRQLSQMAAAPVEYLNRWTNSQYGDLRLVLGEELAGVGPLRSSVANATILTEEWRQSGSGSIWNSNGVREGVKNWITSEASTNRRARR